MTSLQVWVALHRRTLDDATRLVDVVRPEDLDRDTPCAGWDLRALLAHMIGQSLGFAAAITHGDAPTSAFRPYPSGPLGAAPPSLARVREAWDDAALSLTRAFAAAGSRDLTAGVRLAEISADGSFPPAAVVAFQTVDTAVHTWDIASALGRTHRPDADVVRAVLPVARQVPDGEPRRRAGAAFAPALRLDVADDDAWHVTLALLGRRPADVAGLRAGGR